MNKEIKDIFFNNSFNIVIYDSNKYNSHLEAMTSNEFTSFYPDTNSHAIGVLSKLYNTSIQSIEAINLINNSKYKLVVPLFYFDFIKYNDSKISNDLYYEDYVHYEDYLHCNVITSFIIYILTHMNMPIIINEKSYNLDNFDCCFGGDIDKIIEIIYEDTIGNVSIDGLSLKYFYDFLVIKNGNIKNYKKMQNIKNF